MNNPLIYTDPSGEFICKGACEPSFFQQIFNYISGSNLMMSNGLPSQVSGVMQGLNAVSTIGSVISVYSFIRNIGKLFPNNANLFASNNNILWQQTMSSSFSFSNANSWQVSSGIGSIYQTMGNNGGLFGSSGLNNCDICNKNMPNARPGDIYNFADGRQAQFAGNDLVKGGWTDYTSGKPLDAAGNMYDDMYLKIYFDSRISLTKAWSDYLRTASTNLLGVSRNLQEAAKYVRMKEAVYGAENNIKTSLVKFTKGPLEYRTFLNDKTIKNFGTLTKNASRGLGVTSALLSGIDMNQNGIKPVVHLD